MISVKDKTNILSHNIWSCGDLTHNLNGFIVNSSERNVASTERSVNGDYSVRLTPEEDNYAMTTINYTFEEEGTYLLKCKCLNTGISDAKVIIRDSENTVIESINVPVSNQFQEYSIEVTISSENVNQILFRTAMSDSHLYVDDINLSIQ